MALPERRLRTLHLFAGAGGGILADILLGHVPVCAVEIDAYARGILLARQRDGLLPRFPIWDDIRTFRGQEWEGAVDLVAGGFPCQDISSAGKGEGITGSRSGLWSEMARVIREIRPRYVLVENSPLLTLRGLRVVLGDLAEMGYDAEWGVLGAHQMGALHKRDRIWILAHAKRSERWPDASPLRRNQGKYGVSQRKEGAGGAGSSREDAAHAKGSGKMRLSARSRSKREGTPDADGGGKIVADTTRHEQGRKEQRTKR